MDPVLPEALREPHRYHSLERDNPMTVTSLTARATAFTAQGHQVTPLETLLPCGRFSTFELKGDFHLSRVFIHARRLLSISQRCIKDINLSHVGTSLKFIA